MRNFRFKNLILITAVALVLFSCGEDESASTFLSNACLTGTATTKHEHEFAQENAVPASFSHPVVIHLENSSSTDIHANDTASAGHDSIPYHIDETATYEFTMEDGVHESAELMDSDGNSLVTLLPGDTDVPVTLEAGDYALVVHNTENEDEGMLYVLPTDCDSPTDLMTTRTLTAPTKNSGVVITSLTDMSQHTIFGASTSVAAFVGYTVSGTENRPTQVTSLNEYTSLFGPLDGQSHVSYAVSQFFNNGGTTAYVVRVPKKSDGNLPGGNELANLNPDGKGIHALSNYNNLINTIVIPDLVRLEGEEYLNAVKVLFDFVQTNNAFAILDLPLVLDNTKAVIDFLNTNSFLFSSHAARSYGALYYPHVNLEQNGVLQNVLTTGASGSLAGLYAQNDALKGVWTNPLGINQGALLKILSLSTRVNLNEFNSDVNESLASINILTSSGSSPYAVTAKTMNSFSNDFRNINTRRLLLYIENSIKQGIQWAAFSKNDQILWTELVKNIQNFLKQLWINGALAGLTANEAFSIQCGLGSSMTAQDILEGYVNILLTLHIPNLNFIEISLRQQVSP